MATPTLADEAILVTSTGFGGRVAQAMVNNCVIIREENVPNPPAGIPASVIADFYKKRANFATAVLNNQAGFKATFVAAVATDATVIANVTAPGSLTTGNVEANQLLATDSNINNAIFSQFNSFFSPV